MPTMKAAIFVGPGRIVLDEKPIPEIGPLDALDRITTTTICGTDVHILKGEYPVRKGLIVGHEPVGINATIPLEAFAAGLGDHKIVTTLWPGGKERMRRLMNVIEGKRANLQPLVTHRFTLDEIERASELFASQGDGVLKVAITP